jgi:signal transduction histidine kinase
VIEDSLTAVSQLLKDGNIAVSTELPREVPIIVADRDRLMQVMLNLLSNATKFCEPAKGRITVRVAREGRYLRVDVSDNGPGIDPADREIIFEKFRQGGDTLTQKPRGSGLGLAISRQIISHFGGSLWAHGGPGKGSTFSFTVPVKGESRLAGRPEPAIHGQSS